MITMAARQFNRQSKAGNESVTSKIRYDFVLEFTIFCVCSIRDDAFGKLMDFNYFQLRKLLQVKLANKHNLSNAY